MTERDKPKYTRGEHTFKDRLLSGGVGSRRFFFDEEVGLTYEVQDVVIGFLNKESTMVEVRMFDSNDKPLRGDNEYSKRSVVSRLDDYEAIASEPPEKNIPFDPLGTGIIGG